MTSNIVIFDTIVVHIVQNCQTVSIAFRLGSNSSTIWPGITSTWNGFWTAIFPYQSSAIKNNFTWNQNCQTYRSVSFWGLKKISWSQFTLCFTFRKKLIWRNFCQKIKRVKCETKKQNEWFRCITVWKSHDFPLMIFQEKFRQINFCYRFTL